MNEMIQITDLHKYFGDIQAVKGVDLTVAKGEVVVIEENFGVRVTEIVSNADKITEG